MLPQTVVVRSRIHQAEVAYSATTFLKQFSLASRAPHRYNRDMMRWMALGLVLFFSAVPVWAESGTQSTLVVRTDPSGGVRATATVSFPARLEILQAILTDYAKWPELFEVRMRVADLEIREGRALTDLRIVHTLLPGERRLLCESQALPGGGLVTELKGGDFKRYHRVWKLTAVGDGSQTLAEFDLLAEMDTLVPDWLAAFAMRRELETHFRIVREKALERTRQEK